MAYQSIGIQAPVNEMRIVLLGKTGCGKSKTGNTILGHKGYFKFGGTSCSITKECFLRTNTRFDKKLDVVDTPGVFDTDKSNEDIQQEIKRCITLTSPGPHAVILCVRMGRHTTEESEALKHFVKHFGEELLKYAIIMFTHLDQWQADCEDMSPRMTKEEFIKNTESEFLRSVLRKCNKRYIFFDNRLTEGKEEEQVKQLLRMIEQMMSLNNHGCYTNADYEMVEQLLQEELVISPEKTRDEIKQSSSFFEKVLTAIKKFFGKS